MSAPRASPLTRKASTTTARGRLLSVINPSSPRGRHFAAATSSRGFVTEVVTWRQLIASDGSLIRDFPAVVRVDSPGKDDDVTAALVRIGGGPSRIPDHGELYAPACRFRGLMHIMTQLERSLTTQPHLRSLVSPMVQAKMFEKRAVQLRLADADLPVPESTPTPTSVARLWEVLAERRWRHAFVKLDAGSCATGIVRVDPTTKTGITTMHEAGDRMYNTRRLRTVDGQRLDRVLRFLLREGAIVERAISLAQVDGQPFDVRVIVIDQEVAFAIFRASDHPITNLHLGGRRANATRCRELLPQRLWLDALTDCVAAARVFDAPVVGVDVLFDRARLSHYLLELNAFGDFFPRWREGGRTVHEAVLDALERRL